MTGKLIAGPVCLCLGLGGVAGLHWAVGCREGFAGRGDAGGKDELVERSVRRYDGAVWLRWHPGWRAACMDVLPAQRQVGRAGEKLETPGTFVGSCWVGGACGGAHPRLLSTPYAHDADRASPKVQDPMSSVLGEGRDVYSSFGWMTLP